MIIKNLNFKKTNHKVFMYIFTLAIMASIALLFFRTGEMGRIRHANVSEVVYQSFLLVVLR